MFNNVTGQLKSSSIRYGDIVFAIAVVSMVLLLVIPLPTVLLDILLSLSIVLSVVTLLLTMYTEEALEFNSFPSLLLFLTLFRLTLNIASTRLILSDGTAGDIIGTFGEFVTGGSQLIGVIIFTLLTIINFIVITKGSGRIAEVAARFTLDAMPGKQMSIDADLNAGIIDEEQAKRRREKITAEADFYGAMDGASKFVRGDAIAGILITIVNIVGGLIIGVGLKGMEWSDALDTYTTLSIGDGLVSQIPALLISVGAGIIVTRASSSENLAKTFERQMFSNPRVLWVTAGIIFVISIVPGMPTVVMFPISACIAIYAYFLWKGAGEKLKELDVGVATKAETEKSTDEGEEVEKVLFVDPMEIELGYGLIPLVDQAQGGDLLGRITIIRRQIASELGIVVPPVRIRDNMALSAEKYVMKIKGIQVAEGELKMDSYLAMNPGNVEREIKGQKTKEPAFGLPAIWILPNQKEQAEMWGYTVVDNLSVLATHLTEMIHSHAHELVNRQEAQRLVNNAKEYASAVVEELIPNTLPLGTVLRVLQNLLKERIPIRDLVSVLEALADHGSTSKDPEVLTEYARHRLLRTISKQFSTENGRMYIVTLDSKLEQMLAESVQKSEYGSRIVVNPNVVRKIADQLSAPVDSAAKQGLQLVVLTSTTIRRHFKQLIERTYPRLPVLSFSEVVSGIEVESMGVITSDVLI